MASPPRNTRKEEKKERVFLSPWQFVYVCESATEKVYRFFAWRAPFALSRFSQSLLLNVSLLFPLVVLYCILPCDLPLSCSVIWELLLRCGSCEVLLHPRTLSSFATFTHFFRVEAAERPAFTIDISSTLCQSVFLIHFTFDITNWPAESSSWCTKVSKKRVYWFASSPG